MSFAIMDPVWFSWDRDSMYSHIILDQEMYLRQKRKQSVIDMVRMYIKIASLSRETNWYM